MLQEHQLFGLVDKEQEAIDYVRSNATQSDIPLFVAFSGGKDSIVVYDIVRRSGIPFDATFSKTSVDAPEVLAFIRKEYPTVKWDIPKETMFQLIVRKKYPPTRIARYCCEVLKECSGKGRTVVAGLRRSESHKRSKRPRTDKIGKKKMLKPIFHFTDEDVWDYIHKYNLPYPSLYDEGFKRIGCIGCPMTGSERIQYQFSRYPNFKRAYLNAFKKMLAKRKGDGLATQWKDENEVMSWWITDSLMTECEHQWLPMDLP